MNPATLIPGVAAPEQPIPNRQELFKTKCNAAKDKIFEKVVSFTLAEIEKNLSPKQFNEIHVTVIVQKEISRVDQRTGTLFKLVVFDPYKDIVLKRKDIFQFLMGMSTFSRKSKIPFPICQSTGTAFIPRTGRRLEYQSAWSDR